MIWDSKSNPNQTLAREKNILKYTRLLSIVAAMLTLGLTGGLASALACTQTGLSATALT
jgi:hypothetical protein